jgi:hypothetical protein
LFQFLKFLKKTDPSQLTRPLPEIEELWRKWQETELGHKLKTETSLQSISLTDKYAPYVLDYLSYLDSHYPDCKFLFPSGMTVFGISYMVFPEEHLSGRQLLRIVKDLNPTAWLHLFREGKACEVARQYGRTLTSVSEVKDQLDLANESTAYVYVRRFVAKKQPVET